MMTLSFLKKSKRHKTKKHRVDPIAKFVSMSETERKKFIKKVIHKSSHTKTKSHRTTKAKVAKHKKAARK
ncbi:MAG: hypothetical protein F4X82_00165 [Candidatus Spechtbacteria bacterium SB0662_bin_43]|uniref:Uncharacterized protein n=1 Tax=Candidatus Spechtbacteria bacterium SB0662_bin_43 TaxID=2604897 RepID=A0A845DIA1_9BACT|nr:hypothetical protein [Candidatus Spechtbacteria bacterium SB0662_bin_43]